ncbi:acyltransferase [Marinobacterium mangrovicola]|nr:acyltransferase [Marinobacterium mangrovicola]
MNISDTALISFKAKLDRTNPKGITIGEYTHIAFGAVLLTHDMSRNLHSKIKIGSNCFIGANSIILPGVEINDGCIIAAGSVVTKSISPNSIVAGNPAKVIRTGIKVGKYGVIKK